MTVAFYSICLLCNASSIIFHLVTVFVFHQVRTRPCCYPTETRTTVLRGWSAGPSCLYTSGPRIREESGRSSSRTTWAFPWNFLNFYNYFVISRIMCCYSVLGLATAGPLFPFNPGPVKTEYKKFGIFSSVPCFCTCKFPKSETKQLNYKFLLSNTMVSFLWIDFNSPKRRLTTQNCTI